MNTQKLFKIFIILFSVMCGFDGFAQESKPGRFEYMKTVYKLEDGKVEAYMSLRSQFDSSNSSLKDRRISSQEYLREQKNLFDIFYAKVKLIFNEEQYFRWSTCIEKIERYLFLSEDRLVRRAKVRALYKEETKWLESKADLWESGIDASSKYEAELVLLDSLNASIRRILPDDAEWYIDFKALGQNAMSNMDMYAVSFNEGFRIAEIEKKYSIMRHEIIDRSGMKWADKEMDMSVLENKKKEEIFSCLPNDAAMRWFQVNRNRLNNIMGRKYGLDKKQISSFRTAYNKYAIEEYKILNEYNDKSVSEKEVLLREANEIFCNEVKPLFADNKYKEWYGWRQYTFKRRIKAKL
jgi:hypothetical protein